MSAPQFTISHLGQPKYDFTVRAQAVQPADASGQAVVVSHGSSVEYAQWGHADNLPDLLIGMAEQSAILPGIFEFWEGVLIGEGLSLFSKRWDGAAKRMVVEEAYDPGASPWIGDSGALEYLLNAMPDYLSTGNAFVQGLFNRGSLTVSRKWLREFYHTEVIDTRLGTIQQGRIQKAVVGSFGDRGIENIETVYSDRIPVDMFYRDRSEYSNNRCMFHVRRKKAGRRYYGLPVWFSKETEIILKSTTEMFELQQGNLNNEVRPKFHIKIFKDYFKDLYPEPEFSEKDRQLKKEELVRQVNDNLTKPGNAGKTVWSDFFFDPRTGDVRSGIIIEAVESKYNSEAYLKSRDQAVAMLAMATNTNPGLADLIISGKLGSDTGSAVRESYNVLSRTKTWINRHHLLGPINEALRFNFPNRPELFVDINGFELVTTDEKKTGVKETGPAKNTPQPNPNPDPDAD